MNARPDLTLVADAALEDIDAWAHKLIRDARTEHGQHLARYGTHAWSQMPAKQRWGAVLVAAECWRIESDPTEIARRFQIELEQARRTTKDLDDGAYAARAAHHRQAWAWIARPGHPAPEFRNDVGLPEEFPGGPIRPDELGPATGDAS